MRTIAHISDLHFGRIEEQMLPALRASLEANRPDLVVVSGDLTQRAKDGQFAAAGKFLDSLPWPRIVVPGNHDIPLYDLFARWLTPLSGYRRHIGDPDNQFYADNEVAIVGVTTARSLTFKDGRINRRQVERSCALLGRSGPAVTRLVVTHHPFDLSEGEVETGALVGRASIAITGFARCRVDMILSGHLHSSHAAVTPVTYGDMQYAALLIQAGTATSSRRRSEQNAYNLIRINRPLAAVDILSWKETAGEFVVNTSHHFRVTEAGWTRSA
jgi:3',5'-cyclic AMP phosphodiesterase CpdA